MKGESALPLVSVVVPVYNVEAYLRECLDSIVNQSLRQIEIVCVNDCSTDGSLSILREYEAADSRVRIIDRESNEGLSTARNVGMSVVTGKYLLFVDSDDYVDRELCAKALDCAEANRAELVLYDYLAFDGKNKATRIRGRESALSQVDPSNKEQLLNLNAYAWTKLILSDHARSLRLRFPDGLLYEDSPVHWALLTTTSRVALLPERLYFYRQRPDSIGYRRDRKLTDRIRIYDRIREFLLNRSLYPYYRDPFLKQQLGAFYSVHDKIGGPFKRDVVAMIRQRMADEHWRYVAEGQLPGPVRDFFLSLQGQATARLRRSIWLLARWFYRLPALMREGHHN
jgi:glycosyltransferase involved in cell wall biosynthesis